MSLVDSSIAMLGRLLLLLTSAAALRIAPLRPVEVHGRHAAPVASIAVFGASGATGSEAVLQALERGEDVTCLVRDRSKLNAPRSAAGFREVRYAASVARRHRISALSTLTLASHPRLSLAPLSAPYRALPSPRTSSR